MHQDPLPGGRRVVVSGRRWIDKQHSSVLPSVHEVPKVSPGPKRNTMIRYSGKVGDRPPRSKPEVCVAFARRKTQIRRRRACGTLVVVPECLDNMSLAIISGRGRLSAGQSIVFNGSPQANRGLRWRQTLTQLCDSVSPTRCAGTLWRDS
jgi:hypothetical protein